MKEYQAEIIAVGTELLLGQIANTNAQWISKQLAANGINVHYHEVVGDNLKRVSSTFHLAKKRSDIIIVTGGLGPTDDDLTREAFQEVSDMELMEHEESMKKIEAYFKKHHTEMTDNNKKQARVFKGSTVIENKVGMAPGMIITHEGKIWIFLPGVPNEMKSMFTNEIIPYLYKITGQKQLIQSMVLRFIGIGEAKLEHELQDMIKEQSNPTIAPLAQSDGLIIRLTVKADSERQASHLLKECKNKILTRVGKFYVGTDYETIEKKALFMLNQRNLTIGTAESLTGGMFSQKLTSVSGSSGVFKGGIVCYDPQVKTDILGVSTELINTKGTVSYECASALAHNVCKLLKTNIGISFTGIAGPTNIEGKPVGTVFIGIANDKGEELVEKHMIFGDRESIRRKAVLKGYEILFKFLKSIN